MAIVLGLAMLGAPGAGAAAALSLGAISEFPTPTADSGPGTLAAGPEGDIWFREYAGEKIGRIAPSGQIAEFPIPTANARPEGITAGPEGNVWFTERKADQIARITPSGEIASFPVPTPESEPESIAAGPEGDLWFTETNGDKVGRLTSTGDITEFPVPTSAAEPMRIAAGAEGDMWFTEYKGDKVARIAPSGEIAEFPLPDAYGDPWGIARGAEGDMWFAEPGDGRIGRITPAGETAEFAIAAKETVPFDIAAGPEGDMWFTQYGANEIGRIAPLGEITEFSLPDDEGDPEGIAPGADGNMWFGEAKASTIGRIGTGASEPLVTAPAVTGGATANAQQTCESSSWSTWASLQPSASLFSFDGYSWSLEGSKVAAGQTYTPGTADVGKSLTCSETVTYPVLDVTVPASSAPVKVLPPAPKLTRLRQSSRAWREVAGLPHIGYGHAIRPASGTAFAFTLNEQATVKLAFAARLAGRVAHGRCGTKPSRKMKGRRCERVATVGDLSFAGHRGANSIAFQGHLTHSKQLLPGRYELSIVATDPQGTPSASAALRFEILG